MTARSARKVLSLLLVGPAWLGFRTLAGHAAEAAPEACPPVVELRRLELRDPPRGLPRVVELEVHALPPECPAPAATLRV